MGSFTLSIQQKIAILFFVLSLSPSGWAKKIDGEKIPDTLSCGEKSLPLQGAGLRTATIFNIRVYIIAYYGEKKILGLEDPTIAQRPVCFEVTYLRDVDDEDVDKAWDFQFKDSSQYPYAELPQHIKKLQSFFGEIKGERKHLFALLPGKTILSENGAIKGEIAGPEFQKNFLSIWYGKKPPTIEVQEQLLAK